MKRRGNEDETRPSDLPPAEEDAGTGSRRAANREDDATTAIPTGRDPVLVAVVANGGALASRLAAALGADRVSPVTVRSIEALASLDKEPGVVVVDGTDFAAIEAPDLAEALGRLSPTTARVVWASDLPYGRRIAHALAQARMPHASIDRREGVEPLLDVVRSRKV